MDNNQDTQDSGFNNSRAPFEPLTFTEAGHDTLPGTPGDDTINGNPDTPAAPGLPGALAFHTFDNGIDGVFTDVRGGPSVSAWQLVEHQAVAQTATPTRAGPDGGANGALVFNGENSFAFAEHSSALEITQGTVALWVQPDDIHDDSIILSKDQSGTVDGGHFRLGIEDDGRIFLRFAEGDGGSNKAWTSSKAYFTEGQWTHVAVSFTEDGITVYADGMAIPDYAWYREEGNLDSPAQATEAYLLQNQEPWILGTNTASTKDNESPQGFAAETGHLCNPFHGAIADFGVWGGFTPADALDGTQVFDLFSNGPGSALTAASGPQPILAGNDIISGGDGNDTLNGDAGNDDISGGNGHDTLNGGYGDDILEGNDGNDVLEGGRGSDLLIGGAGNDLLVSRSDAGEQRIGQLAIGQPTREDPDNEVNPERQKLYGWEDQPLTGDDIMVGGEGNDTFLFNPLINAKRDIILEHVNDDRSIDWADVAGENNELHDHWVDSFGIDVIADYRAGEDTIAIIGHTVAPSVEHKLIDSDGNGTLDEAISIITVYSNQGNGGGAHTQDLIGQVVVHGDLVNENDIVREAGVTHGIVATVDDIQEALAPTGAPKTSTVNGETVLGYDTRDASGGLGAIVENPQAFIDNPNAHSDRFSYASNTPDGVPAPVAIIDPASNPAIATMAFDGTGGSIVNVAHVPGLAQTEGTIAFNFSVNQLDGWQTLFSKDARNYNDGGHLTAWVDGEGHVKVRYQSTDESLYLKTSDFHAQPGETYHFAFSFDASTATVYIDGAPLVSQNLSGKPDYASGMTGNAESMVFGASATHRDSGQLNHLRDFLNGSIDEAVVADRVLYPGEVFLLSEAGGDFDAIGLDSSNPVNTPADQGLPAPAAASGDAGNAASPAAIAPPPIAGSDGNDTLGGTPGNDAVLGLAGDDDLSGGDGDDRLEGGYGDDRLNGDAGNDFLDGGRGSDLLLGGAGDDLLVARSDAGEQRIGQLAIGEITRPDPDGEVNPDRQKLYGWEGQPLVSDDILVGGEGRDTFLIAPQINTKRDIIEKHVRSDGSIKWSAVAGENNEQHDHWVDSFGIDIIADYDADEDHIAIIGHTVNPEIAYRDVDGDGDTESIITVYSNQGGGGGAHAFDLIGQVIVFGDRVNEDDIVSDAGVTYGIVETIGEIDEALNPQGVLKTSAGPNGETILGYDTRDDQGNLGPIVSNPEGYVDNPYLNEVTFANPSETGPNYSSRAPFEQLDFTPSGDDTLTGSPLDDVIHGDPETAPDTGLPGALSFFTFDNGVEGIFADARGGPQLSAYQLFENQAILQTATPTRAGPDGGANGALVFNGENSFAFAEHSSALEITQGTVALWVQPDDIHDDSIILSKDQRNAGDGGHFRLGIEDDGRIFLRFAEGDGGSNKAWTSSKAYFTEGQWTHVAVSFTEDGITVYADGMAIPDYAWYREEGNLDSPAQATEAYLLQNQEPWILGADTSRTTHNDTAAEFATDDEHLDDAFAGAIADFGVWGGFTPADALDGTQVFDLFSNGPGSALTAASGPQPILAGNDIISGGDGNDTLNGDAGNDDISGGNGHDTLNGGYGDDILEGNDGNDVLEGGRGSDLLIGGAGNDLLVSRSDAGEQRIGQLAIGQPTREDPDNEVNSERQKLYGWEDQPLTGDDIMVGGEGNDTFLFNPLINAKRDIILEHVNDDRSIDWADVAGENNELHDHWVDSFGIDVIADYRAGEDTIAIIGHTVAPSVEHKLIDSDGNGTLDEAISIITVYSNQGNGGGAHTQDLIGQVVVHGDLVNEDDIVREAGVTHGIVATVDDIQEALAPTGAPKTSTVNGETVLGYDTRDASGGLGAIVENPQAFIDNPNAHSDRFSYASNTPDGVPAPVAIIDPASNPAIATMAFDGTGGSIVNVAHVPGLAQTEGTIAFNFSVNQLDGWQTLFSKDARNYNDGGHLTAWVDGEGHVKVRYQSTDESLYLKTSDFHAQPGETYHFAFSFDASTATVYIDGAPLVSQNLSGKPDYASGMTGNAESMVFGASATHRDSGQLNNLHDFFSGSIAAAVVLDRTLYGAEAFLLAEGLLDVVGSDGATGQEPPLQDPPAGDPPAGDSPAGDPPAQDPPAEPPAQDPPAEPPAQDPPAEPPAQDPPAEPPAQDPPAEPPAQDPPAEPPAQDPPAEPPAQDPPAEPPAQDPPAEPPAQDPPAEPPAQDPPAGDSPMQDPPAENLTVRGTRGDDDIQGGDGDDRLSGGRGDDDIVGGDGDDRISGGRGDDAVSAGDGDNRVSGGRGDDALNAGEGNDSINAGNGHDEVDAGDGNNKVVGGRGDDTIATGTGDDTVNAGSGDDSVDAGGGNDVVRAGRGDDQVDGGSGDDNLVGGRGDDELHGGAGDDVLAGGHGLDVLFGGAGNDVMRGGGGGDVFVFDLPENGDNLGMDVIRDFRSSQDTLQVAEDLLVNFSDQGAFTRMTLSGDGGSVVGTVDIYGSSVNPDEDVQPIPDTGGVGDSLF